MGYRLARGGLIDRSEHLEFTFNGRKYRGYRGDTLASALLANGVVPTARSFKYHRPRGIMSCGIEEAGTLVELCGNAGTGNQPVTAVHLTDGLVARSVNCWPSARLDFMSILQAASSLIPAGFYYKTFFWPRWHTYEPLIRRAAGLANAPTGQNGRSGRLPLNLHCDVLIIGSGAAGLSAALSASETGKHIILAEMEPEFGGQMRWRVCHVGIQPAREWVEETICSLKDRPNVTLLENTFVWASREHNMMIACQRMRDDRGEVLQTLRIRAGEIVIATGAHERMLVFPDNDRPGVMLAGSIVRYIREYAVLPGRKVVLFTNNDSAYIHIFPLKQAGVEIVAIVDTRKTISNLSVGYSSNIPVYTDHEITGVNGRLRPRSVEIAPRNGGSTRRISCDLVGVSGGWDPSLQLLAQARVKLHYSERICSYLPGEDRAGLTCTGAAAGQFTLGEAMVQGWFAGCKASGQDRSGPKRADMYIVINSWSIEPYWYSANNSRPANSYVDILNDVTLRDIRLAVQENYSHVEQVKRYTTAGMGLDQGRTGQVNTIAAIASSRDVPIEDIGQTTFRSPVAPVPLGSISPAGVQCTRPFRTTPVTAWNEDNGAVMYESGANWRRPGYFPQPGETMQDAIDREAMAVRNGVGVYDASTLGLFELKGPDVTGFLDTVYTSHIASLKPGRGRYGLMLTEDGLILDDGVCFCLDENRYLLSTSTGNAGRVYHHLVKLLATDLSGNQIFMTDLTHQWGNATICGPRARDLLGQFDLDVDYSREKFPFMSIVDCHIDGRKCMLARVSFTGELSFEINVRTRDIRWLWDEIMARGSQFGITPVGSETSHVLRVEKGFLSIGHEVDGTADAHDLQMGWIMSRTKDNYIGMRAVELRRRNAHNRRELVGLLGEDPGRQLSEGAPIITDASPTPTTGFVTASVWSVVNKRWVALALLESGSRRHGEDVTVSMIDGTMSARVTTPCFHDPEGRLLRG